MILTDREIKVALRAGQIKIDPVPDIQAYSSTSVDLTLDGRIEVWKLPSHTPGVEPVVISPGVPAFKFNDAAKDYTDVISVGNAGHVLEPGSFILAWTREYIALPVEGRLAAQS